MRKSGAWLRRCARHWGILPLMALILLLAPAGSPADTTDKKVSLNKPFHIKLNANPSTGYKWGASYDKGFLTLLKESHQRDPSKPKNYVGVGGVTTFTFRAIRSGETSINFRYKRPWEKEVAETRTFRIMISP
jgi:inhibitor of cysteine peptidase